MKKFILYALLLLPIAGFAQNWLTAGNSETTAASSTFKFGYVNAANTNPLKFFTANVERMRLANNGNLVQLGLGTVLPQSQLHLGQLPLTALQTYTAPVAVDATKEGLLFNAYVVNSDGFRRYSDIASVGYQNGTSGGSIIRFLTNDLGNNSLAERMRIDRNGNIGIGNTLPVQKLHVSGNLLIDGATSTLLFGETIGSPTVGHYGIEYQAGDKGLNFWKPFGSFNNSGGQGFQNYILFMNNDGKIGMGVNPAVINAAGYTHRLSVCGSIRATEVVVQIGWCDYVFAKDYELMPLAELGKFIEENHHLPDVPSAAVVESEGLQLAEMSAIHMKKIEELTLYLLQLEQKCNTLQTRLAALENNQK